MLNTVYFCISSVLLEAQFMCSDQHGFFLQFLGFALSRYVAQVFSEQFFRMVPVALLLVLWLLFFFNPHVLCLYCKVFMF